MKEIKFRAWEKHAKRMLEIIGLEFENNELTAVRVKYPNGHIPNKIWYSNGITIMQFTGLKDKNGKEIYEGDIVDFIDYGFEGESEYNCRGQVIFEDGAWHITNSISTSELFNYEVGAIKVIGNIYENPEILEVEVEE